MKPGPQVHGRGAALRPTRPLGWAYLGLSGPPKCKRKCKRTCMPAQVCEQIHTNSKTYSCHFYVCPNIAVSWGFEGFGPPPPPAFARCHTILIFVVFTALDSQYTFVTPLSFSSSASTKDRLKQQIATGTFFRHIALRRVTSNFKHPKVVSQR